MQKWYAKRLLITACLFRQGGASHRARFGEHRQKLTDLNTTRKNEGMIDYDYKVGQKILVRNKGILRKAQSIWQKDPWTITAVHMNGTIMIQHRNNLEKLNIRRVKLFIE
jgi:hypothetical protein